MLIGDKTRQAADPLGTYLSQSPARQYPGGPPRSADLPPGPRMPFVLDVAYGMLGLYSRRIPFLERCRARYGTPFTLWVRIPRPAPLIWFDDPEDVKAIFLGPPEVLHCGDGSSELEHFFGRSGLAFYEEGEHLARRKVVNRSTHGEALKRINESMREIVEREVASWPRDEYFDLFPVAHRLTLKAMFQITFGPAPDPRLDELLDIVVEMMRFNERPVASLQTQYMSPRMLRVMNAIGPLGFRGFIKLFARAEELIYDVIADRRRAAPDGDDMLAVLLSTTYEDGSPLPDSEVRDEIMTIFLAGSTTTTATIAFGIEFLAREHRVRENVIAEMEADESEDYITATVYELLRRKPPLTGIIPRTVMEPIELNGRWYPRGARLVPTPYLIHHNPEVYPEPYAFRPERFLENPPGNYTWIPFGGGRRRCLGKAIAENELKYVFREVLTQCELHPEHQQPPTTISHTVVARPTPRSRMRLTQRSKQFALA